MRFAAANIFLRALTGNDPFETGAAADPLQRVDGAEKEIATREAIITEMVSVLSSRANHGLTDDEIRARLAPILRMRGLRLPAKQVYLQALDLYAEHPALEFEDTVCVARMHQARISEICSYDTHFDRVRAVQRVVP